MRALVFGLLLACAPVAAGDRDGCQGGRATRLLTEIEADAVRFGASMDGKPPRSVECMNVDSDDDGYVTCTVFRVDRDPYPIQCAVRIGWTGCKPTPIKVPAPSVQ